MPSLKERIAERFDLEKQVVFYMSYHYNKVNQWIHFSCIWPILITAFILAAGTKAFVEQPSFFTSLPFGEYMVLNLSAIAAVVYMAWYIALDPLAGSLGAFLVYCSYIFANYMVQTSPTNFGVSAWMIALPLHIAAWIAQFIGHGVYERRKPALLDSLDQALVTAPMFVLLEVLFPLGYRAELYERVMVQVKINVLAFHGEEAFKQLFGDINDAINEKTPLVARAEAA